MTLKIYLPSLLEQKMSDISLIIKRLSARSTTPEIKPIIAALQQVAAQKAGDDLIAKLRRKLLSLTAAENQSSSKQNLADVAYDTLLILAEFYPLNTEEPITQLDMEDIKPDDRIFVSTGHQFSLTQLIQWHNQRPYRTGEARASKSLLNPFTNSPFSARDLAHISAMANKMRIAINDQPTNNHPAMDEVNYNFIFSLWESGLFWGLFLEIVVYPLLALIILYATLAIAMPAVTTGVLDLSLSWLLFTEVFNETVPIYLLTASIIGLFSLGVALITSELLKHGTDRAVNLVTSPFRWSASFFSTNSVEETPWTEEEENFLLSSL